MENPSYDVQWGRNTVLFIVIPLQSWVTSNLESYRQKGEKDVSFCVCDLIKMLEENLMFIFIQ